MIRFVDREIIIGMDRAHSAHHGREVKDGMRATYGALASSGIAKITDDFLVADRCVEGRVPGCIDNTDAVAHTVQAGSNVRALVYPSIRGGNISS